MLGVVTVKLGKLELNNNSLHFSIEENMEELGSRTSKVAPTWQITERKKSTVVVVVVESIQLKGKP